MPGQSDSHMLGNKMMPSSGEKSHPLRGFPAVYSIHMHEFLLVTASAMGTVIWEGCIKSTLHHLLDTDSSSLSD